MCFCFGFFVLVLDLGISFVFMILGNGLDWDFFFMDFFEVWCFVFVVLYFWRLLMSFLYCLIVCFMVMWSFLIFFLVFFVIWWIGFIYLVRMVNCVLMILRKVCGIWLMILIFGLFVWIGDLFVEVCRVIFLVSVFLIFLSDDWNLLSCLKIVCNCLCLSFFLGVIVVLDLDFLLSSFFYFILSVDWILCNFLLNVVIWVMIWLNLLFVEVLFNSRFCLKVCLILF